MENKFFKNLPFLIFLFFILSPILSKNGGAGFLVLVALIVIAAILFNQQKKNTKGIGNIFAKVTGSGGNHGSNKVFDINEINFQKNMKNKILLGVGGLLLIWLFFASIVIVDAGQTGVYSLFGKVRDQELKSGFHLVIPLAKVTKMSIRTEEYTMSITQGEGQRSSADAIASLTKEGLNVDLDMTVLYRLQEEKASDVYRELGLDYDEKIIRPSIRTSIRDIIAQYDAKDIYSDMREEVAQKIQENVASDLVPRGITVENVLLRNVKLPDNLANAIQEKLQAEQEAQKYDFILQREKKEKERKIIEAEGQRDAQRIINESLSTNYLYYLYINQLQDREGTIYVPTNPESGLPMFRGLGG